MTTRRNITLISVDALSRSALSGLTPWNPITFEGMTELMLKERSGLCSAPFGFAALFSGGFCHSVKSYVVGRVHHHCESLERSWISSLVTTDASE